MWLMAEVATLATDYLAAVLGCALAWPLWARRETRGMAVPFLWLALAALAGGTFHGWRGVLGDRGKIALWAIVSVAMVGVGFSLLVSYGQARLPRRWHSRLRAIAWLKLTAIVVLAALDPGIRWLIVDYGVSMALLAAIYLGTAPRAPASAWLCAAVAFSLAGAAIQRLHIAPAASFNHNDLYHIVQMASMLCFYRAATVVAREWTHG
jgi:hypothetical protein